MGLIPWRVVRVFASLPLLLADVIIFIPPNKTHTVGQPISVLDARMLIFLIGTARILHYKRLSRSLRAKAGLPPLVDENDLPDPMYDPNHVQVLSDEQQQDLHDCKIDALAHRYMHPRIFPQSSGAEVHAQPNVV